VAIRRRNLRSGLVAVGCLLAAVEPPGLAAGAVLLAAGSALHLWSKGCLEQNQRLVTAGPYRFVRNPFYLANLLIDLGLCCLIGRAWVALPFLVLWALAYRATIASEEQRLAALFPGAFERYVAAVPRLIPTGRALPRAEAEGGFSLANPALAQGSEYARILGVWVAAATIVAWDWIRAEGLSIFAPAQTMGLGLVALLPVAWVAKIALAELFRRPETALLPFSADPGRRRPVTFGLVVAVWLVVSMSGPGSVSTVSTIVAAPSRALGSIALAVALAALLALSVVRERPGARGVVHAVLGAAVAIFAASRGALWLASGTILWVVLAALDDAALVRLEAGRGRRDVLPAERRVWPAFRPIAILTPIAVAALASLRRIV
jgi:hypothetical protein